MQTVNFEFQGPRQLVVPDGELCLDCARDIIEGRSYPLPVEDHPVHTVIDLGAHAGEFTLMAALRWPGAQVMAYEPQPDLAELCRQNMKLNGLHAFVYAEAVDAEANESAPLYFSELGSVASSLFPGKDREGNTATACQMVRVVGADEIAEFRPDVLKLDVEGSEYRILDALREELGKIAYIYIEFHSEDIRVAIERLLLPTHTLSYARIPGHRQGEVRYTLRSLL